MPDENILTLRRANQARTDFALIESNLEFLASQLAQLPTREYLCRMLLCARLSARRPRHRSPTFRSPHPYGDGRGWTFRTGEHGGDEPDNMPQTIKATDAAGRSAIYVLLTRGGKIVVPRPYPADHSEAPAQDSLARGQCSKVPGGCDRDERR
jgi:hypothetical protein